MRCALPWQVNNLHGGFARRRATALLLRDLFWQQARYDKTSRGAKLGYIEATTKESCSSSDGSRGNNNNKMVPKQETRNMPYKLVKQLATKNNIMSQVVPTENTQQTEKMETETEVPNTQQEAPTGAELSEQVYTQFSELMEKEKALGADLKFEDIIDEVAGVYPKIMHEGTMEAGAWSCGMVAGLVNDIPTVQDLIDEIMSQADEIINSRLKNF